MVTKIVRLVPLGFFFLRLSEELGVLIGHMMGLGQSGEERLNCGVTQWQACICQNGKHVECI